MVKAGRPTFKSLKTEREGVLPWGMTITLIHHYFVFGKRIPRLEVFHFVANALILDIFGPMVIVPVGFRFNL